MATTPRSVAATKTGPDLPANVVLTATGSSMPSSLTQPAAADQSHHWPTGVPRTLPPMHDHAAHAGATEPDPRDFTGPFRHSRRDRRPLRRHGRDGPRQQRQVPDLLRDRPDPLLDRHHRRTDRARNRRRREPDPGRGRGSPTGHRRSTARSSRWRRGRRGSGDRRSPSSTASLACIKGEEPRLVAVERVDPGPVRLRVGASGRLVRGARSRRSKAFESGARLRRSLRPSRVDSTLVDDPAEHGHGVLAAEPEAVDRGRLHPGLARGQRARSRGRTRDRACAGSRSAG